jgi:putative membrane protein
MAAERTWLAWWRTALAATAGALAVGRVAPQVLDTATWPYVALGIGYAVLAVGLLLAGAYRQRVLGRAVVRNEHDPLRYGVVMLFTIGGIVLALATIVLVIAQS